jgi:hypothetical protein
MEAPSSVYDDMAALLACARPRPDSGAASPGSPQHSHAHPVATAQQLLDSPQLQTELMAKEEQLLSQAPAQSLRLPEAICVEVPRVNNAIAAM